MMNPEIRDQAYRFFIEEAAELLQAIEAGLLSLSEERSKAKVHEIMRAAHSIKGGAASVDLETIKILAHRLEDFFRAFYHDGVILDSELESLLLQGFDCLKNPLTEQIETGNFDRATAIAIAEPIFARIEARLGTFLNLSEDYLPSSTDLGIDIATSIFEIDVTQELERLTAANIDLSVDVAAELRATVEIFAAFAELLNLPGWAAIGQVAIDLLDDHPQQARKITELALADWQVAREQVLAGDRTSGGSPSPELISFTPPPLKSAPELHSLTRQLLQRSEPHVSCSTWGNPKTALTPQRTGSPSSFPASLEDDIRNQAYQFFIEEASELVQIIEMGLLSLREDRSQNKVHEIMRAAHSIKGGAASVGLEAIRTIAHRLEDYFKALYCQDVVFDAGLEGLLLQGFDCLKASLLQQIESGHLNATAALAIAEPIFTQIEDRLGNALHQGEEYLPSSADLGIDIVASIFEVDVAQSLETLTRVLTNDTPEQLTQTLESTLEVFEGFSQMLGLPGLTTICQSVRTAITQHPQQVHQITKLAIGNFQQAREQVLTGDRTIGGTPSPELLTFTPPHPSSPPLTPSPVWDEAELLTLNESELPSLDEIFGTHSAQTSDNLPSLEEIFGAISEEVPSSPHPLPFSPSSLDEVFGAISEEAPLLSSTPSLDEVFGAISEEVSPHPLTPSSPTPSLDEVFGTLDTTRTSHGATGHTSPAGHQPGQPLPCDGAPVSSETMPKTEDIAATIEAIQKSFEQFPAVEKFPPTVSNLRPSFLTQSTRTSHGARAGRAPVSSLEQDNTYISDKTKTIKGDVPAQRTSHGATGHTSPAGHPPGQPLPCDGAPVSSTLSVRVDFNRLERMSNVVGELAINRNSLSLQNEQLQTSVKELLNRFGRFETMTHKLRELSDQILIAPMKDQVRVLKSSLVNDEDTSSEINFDALEMDRYGKLYSLLQGLLEEMMQLEESVDDIVLFARGSNQTLETQRQMLTSLRDELMWARMLPLSEVLNRFPRVLRDLSNAYNKSVRLKLTGISVLVDKVALEKLYDPLLHLLRNAFDHGIESPMVRREQGKPEEGIIEIRAYHQGNQTIIEVKDDGQGLDFERIYQQALKKELATAEQLAVMTRERLAELVFEPGFSTAEKVSELSGRGVGLDVVRDQLHSLKGTVTVNSIAGLGTTFTLRLPLTLTIAKLLVCSIHPSSSISQATAVAIPSDSIEEIIIPQDEQVKKSGNQRFLLFAEQIIPIYSFSHLLDYRCPLPETFSSKALALTVPSPLDWGLPLLLLRRGQQLYALEVDRLVTEQELVIKPFGGAIAAPGYTYGCTILGDGTLIPVVNGIILLEQSLEMGTTASLSAEVPSGEPGFAATKDTGGRQKSSRTSHGAPVSSTVTPMPTILVVDDSAALRRTLALTLQKCGYRVLQARDGREALEQLHQSSGIQLVICDVEMPNMNGFEFLGQRRREPQLNQIPVAMLTSRSSDKHRQLAMHLGASAYFTKPYIEQQFLAAIQNLIAQPVNS